MARALARHGMKKDREETPQEFVRKIENQRLRTPVEQFTSVYESVRFGNWKAIREPMMTGDVQLYDLSRDPAETNNLAASRPDLVKRAVAYMREAHVDDPAWKVQR